MKEVKRKYFIIWKINVKKINEIISKKVTKTRRMSITEALKKMNNPDENILLKVNTIDKKEKDEESKDIKDKEDKEDNKPNSKQTR